MTIFLLLEKMLGIFFLPANYAFTKHQGLYYFYDKKPEVDTVLIGPSVVYSALNPKIFDEEMNKHTINFSTSAQDLVDSYYILDEVFDSRKIDNVILGIHPEWQIYKRSHWEEQVALSSMNTYDIFKPSLRKVNYFLNSFSPDDYASVFFKSYRYRGNKFAAVRKLVNEHALLLDDNILNEQKYYKGYVYSDEAMQNGYAGPVPENLILEKNAVINDKKMEYLLKIAELCQKNDVELTVVFPPKHLACAYAYDCSDLYRLIQTTLAEYDVDCFDFNLAKPNYIQWQDDDFRNMDHLSTKGGNKLSKLIIGLKKEMDEGIYQANEWFYSSYKEMINAKKQVVNTWLTTNYVAKTAQIQLDAHAYYHPSIIPEYQFLYKTSEDMEFSILQDFSASRSCLFMPEENTSYIFQVKTRAKQNSLDLQQAEIAYLQGDTQ